MLCTQRLLGWCMMIATLLLIFLVVVDRRCLFSCLLVDLISFCFVASDLNYTIEMDDEHFFPPGWPLSANLNSKNLAYVFFLLLFPGRFSPARFLFDFIADADDYSFPNLPPCTTNASNDSKLSTDFGLFLSIH